MRILSITSSWNREVDKELTTKRRDEPVQPLWAKTAFVHAVGCSAADTDYFSIFDADVEAATITDIISSWPNMQV